MSDASPTRPDRAAVPEDLRRLILHAGGDPDSAHGRNIQDTLLAALKLVNDGSDVGEVKLISRSLKELRYALKVFRPYRETPKISVFGSARTPEDHPDYLQCVRFSRTMAEAGWMVITGAGDGIMRAGHDGAQRENSFGVAIRLPFETTANDVIAGDPKLITFRYFFTRKLIFMWMSHAVALFPGGFGTQDEGFEALTLIQTGKAPLVPIVCVDAPAADGNGYWHHWDNYIRKSLLANGWISPEDQNLYFVTDDASAAARHVIDFYRNYHSQRYVRDRLALRVRRPITAKQLEALNEEFAVLVADGQIEQSGPLQGERDAANLPRVHFHHTKSKFGKLRALIDRLNEFDAENAR
ncbi:MAG: LOG family protein [Planctomycetota bacterium]